MKNLAKRITPTVLLATVFTILLLFLVARFVLPPAPDQDALKMAATAKTHMSPEQRALGDPIVNSIGMVLLPIPAGEFQMGRQDSNKDAPAWQQQVNVTLTSDFWLGKYEVTHAEWKQLMHSEPWVGEKDVKAGDEYPATYVSWNDATEFCRRLTDLERRSGRLSKEEEYMLPTQAQWEYACRAGTTTRYSFGDDASLLSDYAWWGAHSDDGNTKSKKYAHRVGQKRSNPWGLHDMHGNVAELCQDFDGRLVGGRNPLVTLKGNGLRVTRGGHWSIAPPWNCRSAFRWKIGQDVGSPVVGFRVARSSDGSEGR